MRCDVVITNIRVQDILFYVLIGANNRCCNNKYKSTGYIVLRVNRGEQSTFHLNSPLLLITRKGVPEKCLLSSLILLIYG